MKKKIIYISIFVIVLLLGYFNYFAEDADVGKEQQVIETTNVTYKNDDYTVEAKKQKDYIKENETGFEKAKAKVNEMLISGDNVFIDKVRNLALKHNILGISPNGWKFKGEEVNYNKLKDEITSTTGVMAENEGKGVKISGQNFTTDSKMSYIKLDKDVVLENKSVALKGDKGSYDDLTKVVNIADNIRLEGRGQEAGQIDGHFKHLRYDMENKILQAWEPYDITYKGVKLNAEKLYLKEDTQELKINDNVSIEVNDFNIKVANIEKDANKDIVVFNGPIVGKNKDYSFVADGGEYNTKTKVFEATGNIKGKSSTGDLLIADKLIYDTNSEILIVVANDNVDFTSKDGKLITKKIVYNVKTKELTTQGSYTFNGPQYESEGQDLYYNDITKDIKLTKGYVLDKSKKQRASGDLLAHNMTTKDTSIVGNANIKNVDYELSTQEVIYKGDTQLATIPKAYTVKFIKDGTLFKGQKATYSKVSNEFLSEGEVQGQGRGYTIFGENLEYNSLTGFGKFNSKVVVENKEDKVKLTGDNFTFERDKYLNISGNLNIETENFMAKSQSAKYNLKDKKIYIPEEIYFNSKDGKSSGTVKNGIYSTVKGIFKGNKFDGVSGDKKAVSDEIYYYDNGDKLVFVGHVVMTDPESVVKGNKIEYYPNSETINIIGNYVIDYKDFTFKGVNGNFNNSTGILKGEQSVITSKTGDEFISDRLDGNLKELILDFSGNIHGHVYNDGQITNFKGDYARLYFKRGQKYEILRSEIRQNAVFTQDDKILKSNYIEVDPNRHLVFSREDTRLIIEDKKNGRTEITSDVAEINTQKDIATLIGNVQIDNRNAEHGLTHVTSDKGIIDQKNNTLEFIGNVKIENNDSIVQADKGIYNMTTKKIKALGDVYVDYKK